MRSIIVDHVTPHLIPLKASQQLNFNQSFVDPLPIIPCLFLVVLCVILVLNTLGLETNPFAPNHLFFD